MKESRQRVLRYNKRLQNKKLDQQSLKYIKNKKRLNAEQSAFVRAFVSENRDWKVGKTGSSR